MVGDGFKALLNPLSITHMTPNNAQGNNNDDRDQQKTRPDGGQQSDATQKPQNRQRGGQSGVTQAGGAADHHGMSPSNSYGGNEGSREGNNVYSAE
jgi:hypothetical protein